jgi:hypothetical protein
MATIRRHCAPTCQAKHIFRLMEHNEFVLQVRERLEQAQNHYKLHDTFHVGLLKKFHGATPVVRGMLPPIHHGRACLEPVEVIKSRVVRGRRELLVRWTGQTAANIAWLDFDETSVALT